MNATTGWIIAAVIALCVIILVGYPVPAHAQYTCEEVRQAYDYHGAAVLNQWAREYKVTPAQRRAAIRCIHAKRVVSKRTRR